jgi:hypothetical protein
MIKHIGRHGERKVVIAYNTVPNEDHMALVVYSDSLPSAIHDEVMRVVESTAGQSAKILADALFRNVGGEGSNTLSTLHKGGYLKKVQTKQVILTPNAKTSVRLDELNKILAELEIGSDAAKKMADIDAGRGYKDPEKNQGREVGEPVKATKAPTKTKASTTEALTDADLAQINLDQAAQMEAQAKTLLAEAKRLKEEAKQFAPAKAKNVRKPTTKKATA